VRLYIDIDNSINISTFLPATKTIIKFDRSTIAKTNPGSTLNPCGSEPTPPLNVEESLNRTPLSPHKPRSDLSFHSGEQSLRSPSAFLNTNTHILIHTYISSSRCEQGIAKPDVAVSFHITIINNETSHQQLKRKEIRKTERHHMQNKD